MSLLSAGDSAPDVGFSTADRQEINLVDFKGSQKVVLAFYGRAFTGG